MNFVLNNLQRLICHNPPPNQPTNQPTNQIIFLDLSDVKVTLFNCSGSVYSSLLKLGDLYIDSNEKTSVFESVISKAKHSFFSNQFNLDILNVSCT